MKRSRLWLVFILALCAGWVQAQFTASGTVTDPDGNPLIGVTVVVKGTSLGTITDLDGKYMIEIPSSSATLEFSYLGFRSVEYAVSAGEDIVNVVMNEDVTRMEEVVVTGLATTVKRSNLGNSVASISATELTGITTQPTLDGALYGKFTGAEIRANSGAPGGGMSIRLRGVTSIFGDQQPLYIIDGVFLDNSTTTLGTNIVSEAASGGNTSTNQDDATNRIADIDPEDIESIEILKGASAAAIYGSRAAGGVVLITTKRGKSGKAVVSLRQSIGFSRPTKLLGVRDWDVEKVRTVFGDSEADRFQNNPYVDYEAELYDHTNLLSTTRLEVSGGSATTTYLLAGTYKNEDGIVNNTGYEKASVRLNLQHQFNDWLDINASSNYINSTADRGFFNNSNTNATVGYGLAFTRPWDVLQADETGTFPGLPRVGSNVLETVELVTNQEKVNRFIGGATLNARLFTNTTHNLKLAIRAGIDQYTLRTTAVFPRSISYFRSPTSLGGVSVNGNTVNSTATMSAALVHSWYMNESFSLRTSVGVTQADFDKNTVIGTATGLNGSQTNLDQAANIRVYQLRTPQHDKGFFAQAEANYEDKVIATVGITGDKSTNNGDANQLYYYPKANVAVNVHEFASWQGPTLNTLKLRAAYGEAGRFAMFNDRFNAYNGTLIGMNSGLITSVLLGNTEVGPERQTELEFGFDAGLFNSRVLVEFSYYIKSVDDLLLQQEVPTSTGYTRKVVNAGELENKGIEIGLNINAVNTRELNWSSGFKFWKNQSEITRLDVPAFNLGGFAASLGQYRIQQGESATQIVGTYNPDDCGTPDCSDLDPDGDGFRVYGDAEPDFNLSWNNFISWKNFELNFIWHWKNGGEGVNLSTLLYDLAGMTWDYDDIDLDPAGVMGNGDYRTSQWFAGNAGPWIEDSGYIRLREVGLYYLLPNEFLGSGTRFKIGVSGRNLINIFDYNSYDPEVSNFGGNVLANTIEVTPFPYAKQVNFHIKANF